MDRQYTYTVDIAAQAGGYLVTVPALQGCQTWGRTHEEAVANAREAIECCLEGLAKMGRPFPIESPHRKLHLNVRFPVMA
jgi:antitoxin HicB